MLKILFILSLVIICGDYSYAADNNSLSLSLPDEGIFSSRILQILFLITTLSIAPSLLMTVTAFTRITIVLSFLRSALGAQQTPPNMVIMGLSLFITLFVMMPTFKAAYYEGIEPALEHTIDEQEALEKIYQPFYNFMYNNTREKDLVNFITIADKKIDPAKDQIPFEILVPSFMVSELRRAFYIGFLIFVPFLVIDLLVASILMAMGMMMLPPVTISLPFKIIFFVLIDGWLLLTDGLIKGFNF